MTYARSRLLLGILNVGAMVIVSLIGLYNAPAILSAAMVVEQLIPYLSLFYILFSLPFDLMGGYILPKRFQKSSSTFGQWIQGWLKGVIVQGLILALSLALLYLVFKSFPNNGVRLIYVVGIQLLFAFLQPQIAFCVGRFQKQLTENKQTLWSSTDIGFTGGVSITGTSIVPHQYYKNFAPPQYDWVTQRRALLQKTPMNIWGVLGAVLFNTCGVLLVTNTYQLSFLAAGDLLVLSFGMTLWSFLGVLILPAISQKAVLKLDSMMTGNQNAVLPSSELAELFRQLDSWQDEEPSRQPVVQKIFHPLPSVAHRVQNIQTTTNTNTALATWHIARRALFLSWPFMGLLNRSVHCNVGRPDLWVFLPCEG